MIPRRKAIITAAMLAFRLCAADTNNLAPGKIILLPDVQGRIDHFAQDAQGQRLFMAALGNNTVEVLELSVGKRVRSIGGCSKPQGLAFVPGANRLFIANGGSGTVKILDGSTFETVKILGDMPDADNVRYDEKAGLIYVGYGDGALVIIGATNGELVATIPLDAHPESFQLEKNGSRLFVNIPDANQIAVVDREKRAVIAKWPMEEFHANFPMALDEANHRVFVGCRKPARLVVLDSETGKKISDLEISGDTDDLFYDAPRKLIYASCGAGFLDVIEQRDADSYVLRERIPTVSGARTAFFSPERNELYLAARAGLVSGSAEVRVFPVAPPVTETNPLKLIKTIPLPDITGGFNHLAVDAARHRLFATATGKHTVEVIDTAAGKVERSLTGQNTAAAACFSPEFNQLYVTRRPGVCIYDGETLAQTGSVELGGGLDELHCSTAAKQLYVGCMGSNQSAIAIISLPDGKKSGVIKLPNNPQGFAAEQTGRRIFANVPRSKAIYVLDAESQTVLTNWPLAEITGNFPAALDEAHHRLFVGCRKPARLLVLDTTDGRRVADVPIDADTDDLSYDAANKRIYVACGSGALDVIQQTDADHYQALAKIPTPSGSRNCVFSASAKEFYLTVPQRDGHAAELRVFSTN